MCIREFLSKWHIICIKSNSYCLLYSHSLEGTAQITRRSRWSKIMFSRIFWTLLFHTACPGRHDGFRPSWFKLMSIKIGSIDSPRPYGWFPGRHFWNTRSPSRVIPAFVPSQLSWFGSGCAQIQYIKKLKIQEKPENHPTLVFYISTTKEKKCNRLWQSGCVPAFWLTVKDRLNFFLCCRVRGDPKNPWVAVGFGLRVSCAMP
jgi:hypothetical protein